MRRRHRDRDSIYGSYFSARAQGMGIEQVISAPRAPWQKYDPMFKGDDKAFCEAYANNRYAPDVQTPWAAPYDTPTSKK